MKLTADQFVTTESVAAADDRTLKMRQTELARVLIVHNFYQQTGGEDRVVENELALLRANGHEAHLYSISNDGISSAADKARVFLNVHYNARSRDDFLRELARVKPNVVHVHNFFPLLTTSIYDACIRVGVPVVQTLHNFRIMCAGVHLMRDGQYCEKCIDGSPYQSVVHRCYRGSVAGSLAVARMIDANRQRGTWRTKVDRFVALTRSAKSLFIRAGLPEDKIVVKPNFAPDPGEIRTARRHGALFVGRLSAEKGAMQMIAAWRCLGYPLRIVGDGPLMKDMKAMASPNVKFLGRLPPEAVAEEMRRAAMLISVSTCLEGFPVVIAEALACGLPPVVSDMGAPRDIVKHGITGLHVKTGDPGSLAAAVRALSGNPEDHARMSNAARADYLDHYTPQTNYRRLVAIYNSISGPRGACG